jgi:superfamily II DNA or RNA helicase
MSPAPLQAGEVVRIRDERWRIIRRVPYDRATAIEAAGCDAGNRNGHATFLLPFETIERVQAYSVPRVVGRRRWRRAARRTLATASPSLTSLRAATPARLRIISFQLEPVLALVRGEGCRFLIADAVGLGKTVQAGLMIAETLARRPDGRTLVVTPAALREQWREEIESRFGLGANILDAAGIARLTSQLPAGVNPWSVRPVVITSIDYIKRPEVMRSIETLVWDLVVFDEAHNLAGRSDRSAAAGVIGNRARALVLLTATPHSGDDQAFDRLCHLGHLGRAGRLLVFRRTRIDVGLPHTRRDTLLRVRPTMAEVEMHRALMAYAKLVWNRSRDAAGAGAQLAMSVLARRACSSAASLVRSVERRLGLLGQPSSIPDIQPDLPFDEVIDDEEPAVSLRSPGLPDAREERSHLLRLLDLARDAATAESKLAALRRLISRVNEPVIVFTEYRDTLREISATLAGTETVQLHGGLTARERNDALRRFIDGTVRVLLATDAASEGLNLHQRCRLVINLELPWTPLRLEQRAGRVDRIGQSDTVHVVRFVAQGTCEETTVVRLARRIARIQGSMHLTSSIPNERRVAESILGDAPIPDVAPAASIGSGGASTIDLRHEAEQEAGRIASARSLLDADSPSPTDSQGVIANLCRRRARPAPRCVWVFSMTISSSSGEVVCEPLVALTAELRHAVGWRQRDIRRCLMSDSPSIVEVLSVAQHRTLLELRARLRRPAALWTCREQDLMAELHDCRARLSAGLMQRSLFDNRKQRLTDSQSALLDEALSQSGRRLRDLEALRAVEIESCRLTLAAVIE